MIGFMGVGKTTLGRAVAERLSMPFVDLDEAIERTAGMTICEIFAQEGEAGFREREAACLGQVVATTTRAIVATGGGTFANETNRRLMEQAGRTVWLKASSKALLERAREGSAHRPMWRSDETARELLAERQRHYRLAELHVELDDERPEAAVDRLHRLLAPFCENA